MEAKLLIPLVGCLLLMLVNAGTGLKCHQCTSKIDAQCDDPFYHADKPDVPKTKEFLKECPTDDGHEYTLCRKIYQNVRGDDRVIRSCGYEEDPQGRPCYSTVLEEYNTYVCQCKDDGCNSASMMSLSLVGVVSTVLLSYLIN